jgi:hypothetical protein
MSETFDIEQVRPPATCQGAGELRWNSSEPRGKRRLGLSRMSHGMPLHCRSTDRLERREAQPIARTKGVGAQIALGGTMLHMPAPRKATLRTTTPARSAMTTERGASTTRARSAMTRVRTAATTRAGRHDSSAERCHDSRADRCHDSQAGGHNSSAERRNNYTGEAWCRMAPVWVWRFTGVLRKMLSPRRADCFTLVTFAFECVERRYV